MPHTNAPDNPLVVLPSAGSFPKVTLTEPTASGYRILAAEVDRRLPFAYFIESGRKRALLVVLKRAAQALQARSEVIAATVFKTLIAPPGRGAYLKLRPRVHIARYDVVLLVEAESPAAADALTATPEWQTAERAMRSASENVLDIAAINRRRIGPVDHARDGVFLFNYFYADDIEQNLDVWQYTAGWFQDQTGLDNSTLLVPVDPNATDYTIINHCRWDRLRDIVPSLLFKRSFRDYVLAHFEANRTAPIPILYRLA